MKRRRKKTMHAQSFASSLVPHQVACVFFDPLDKTMVSVGRFLSTERGPSFDFTRSHAVDASGEDGKVCEWSTENWSSATGLGAVGQGQGFLHIRHESFQLDVG